MPQTKINIFDCASEIDLQRIENIISRAISYDEQIIISPFLFLMWKEDIGNSRTRIRIKYFERSNEEETKQAETILNTFEVIHKEIVNFPYLKVTWKE